MKKGNMLDIAQKAVRESSKTNMYQSNSVQYWAYHMGFFEYVTWYEENKRDYTTLMITTDYDNIPSVDVEELLDCEDAIEARKIVEELFPNEIKSYNGGFHDMKKLPFTTDDFIKSKKGIYQYINEVQDEHVMNFLFEPPFGGKDIFWFQDGIFTYSKTNDLIKVTGEEWENISQNKHRFTPENMAKFEKLNKMFRIRRLMK